MKHIFTLANAIHTFRVTRNWQQKQLANLLNVSRIHIESMENMRGKPSVPLLLRLYIYGFSIDAAFSEDKDYAGQIRANLHVLVNHATEQQLKNFAAIFHILQHKD